jgi:hypothetical protein
MVDWVNEQVYGRLTFRELFTFIPNPDTNDAKLPLEKELNWIAREIREMGPNQLSDLKEAYKIRIKEALSIKNPYFEERRGHLIAYYMKKVIKEIDNRTINSLQVNKTR